MHIYSTAKETHIFTISFYLIKSNDILLLLSKLICLCMAIGFTAFSCHNAIHRNNMQIFVKNSQKNKILAHCVKNRIFNAMLLHVSSAWCNQLENGKKN